jgi:hypothetical protein
VPKDKVRKRGGSTKTRTVKVSKDKYMRCEVVRKPGPRGGKTVCGPVKTKKKKT